MGTSFTTCSTRAGRATCSRRSMILRRRPSAQTSVEQRLVAQLRGGCRTLWFLRVRSFAGILLLSPPRPFSPIPCQRVAYSRSEWLVAGAPTFCIAGGSCGRARTLFVTLFPLTSDYVWVYYHCEYCHYTSLCRPDNHRSNSTPFECADPRGLVRKSRSLCRYKTASELHIPQLLKTSSFQELARKPRLTPASSALPQTPPGYPRHATTALL